MPDKSITMNRYGFIKWLDMIIVKCHHDLRHGNKFQLSGREIFCARGIFKASAKRVQQKETATYIVS
jgi:hypothetical protein